LAIEKPEQIVPGSDTAKKLAEAPAADLGSIDAPAADADAPIDPAVMEIGKAQFMVCGACHGQNGEGGPAGPPLAGSEWVTGPVSNLVIIQLRGLKGPITVAGKEYNFPAGMTPMAYQTDEQIAGVLTYIRNSFGNKASAVKPEQVTALRGEVGKPQATVEELTKP
jgi:mono/diheme cytochrome c family protein